MAATPDDAPAAGPTRAIPAIRIAIALLTIAAFAPACRFGFINLDDPAGFIENTGYRGLSPDHLRGFFTSYLLGHYQPVFWLTFGLDHALWGVSPDRFHATQLFLHVLAVLIVHQLARRLLAMVRPPGMTPTAVEFAAAMTALVFAVHPLRVESVVWLSARTDILATIFLALATLAYLNHTARPGARFPLATFLLFVLAVLSKEIAIVFPLVLVLLDVHPLTRPAADGRPIAIPLRESINEKLPFFAVSLVGALNAFAASRSALSSLDQTPWSFRLLQVPFSLAFYPFKMLLPIELSPLREFPGTFGIGHLWALASIAACLIAATMVFALRSSRPGLALACAVYIVLILPVSGIMQRGPQIAADRYSYIACLPFAFVLGAALGNTFLRQRLVAGLTAAAILAPFMLLTTRYVSVWRNSESLWRHAIRVDSHNATAHANLADALADAGRIDEAVREYETALTIRPTQPHAHRNIAAMLNRTGDLAGAAAHYLAESQLDPADASTRYFLGTCYERLGDADKASGAYREALRINEDFALAHLGLARLFLQHNYVNEAEPRLRRVLELDARNLAAIELLAQVCANTGRPDEAGQLYDRAISEARQRGESAAAAALSAARQRLAASQPSN